MLPERKSKEQEVTIDAGYKNFREIALDRCG